MSVSEYFSEVRTNSSSNMTASTVPLAPLELLSEPLQYLLTVLYSLTAIFSFFGNIMVLLVLLLGRKSSRELKKFLINLSLSDIAMSLFSIPFTYTDFMLGRWIFLPVLCPLASFMTVCAMCVSIYTLTIIGIDRYFAIAYPLNESLFHHHSALALILLWLLGILFSAPQLHVLSVVPFPYGNNSYLDCREDWSGWGDEKGAEIYSIVLFVCTFCGPMIALTIIYGAIIFKLSRRMPINETQSNGNSRINDQRTKASVKAVKMMIIVVVLFMICWTPIQIFNLVTWIIGDALYRSTEFMNNLYVCTFFVCHFLAMAHSMINPLIYSFMSDNFKEDLKYIWRRYRRRNLDEMRWRNNSCRRTTSGRKDDSYFEAPTCTMDVMDVELTKLDTK